MMIAVLLVFFTGSAYAAAEWNFYGSARIKSDEMVRILRGGQNVGNMADIVTTGSIVSSAEGITGDLDGSGYTQTKLDVAGAETEKCKTMYLQSTIFLAPGVFLTPEIGYCDMKDSAQPEITYFGIKWQINF